MTSSQRIDNGIRFMSIGGLLRKLPVSLLASAIEQKGVFVRDNFGRYIEVENDVGKGWVCRFDDKSQTHKIRHMIDEGTASRFTKSRAIALLEKFCTYKETEREYPTSLQLQFDTPLKILSELSNFGWSSEDPPDFDAMQQEMATLRSPKPIAAKQQKQLDAISDVINNLGYDPLCIPPGGKAEIKTKCLENTELFTQHSFEHAWKAGKKVTPQLWEVENLDLYKNN